MTGDDWYPPEDMEVLLGLVRKALGHHGNPRKRYAKIFLDVGIWAGHSTYAINEEVRRDPRAYVIGMDPWDPEWNPEAPKAREEFLRRIPGSDVAYMPCTVEEAHIPPAECVFIHLDADHGYPSTLEQIRKLHTALLPGGIFCGHDISWETVRRAVEEAAFALGVGWKSEANVWWFTIPEDR